jgi:hypothetical protein
MHSWRFVIPGRRAKVEIKGAILSTVLTTLMQTLR